jgi:hypothetical protein
MVTPGRFKMSRISQVWLVSLLSTINLSVVAFFATAAHAGEWKLLNVERLDLEYTKLEPSMRDPYVPQYTGSWRERAALRWRVSILGPIYWDNNVHTETLKSGEVKTVGWEWEAGLRLNKYIDIFHHHHSRHVMEDVPEKRFRGGNQFPVEDGYGIRFKFIPETKGRGIF